MIKNISKIEFNGAAFPEGIELSFFNSTNERMALIFGRNGSGKSTISRAIRKAKGESEKEIISAKFEDYDNNEVVFDSNWDNEIFVFDENYVQKNVRLKLEGLDTIVMFGKQVELDDKILSAMENLKNCDDVKKSIEMELEEYNSISSDKSPKYYLGKIMNALKGDDNWAGRLRNIESRKNNAPVNESTYTAIIKNKPTRVKGKAEKEYFEKLAQLSDIRNQVHVISTPVKTDFKVLHTEREVIGLLSKIIEHPELTSREEKLLKLAEDGNGDRLNDIKSVFSDDKTTECPFCFRPIDSENKKKFSRKYQKGFI